MSAWAANRPSPLAATAALILAVLFTGGLLAPWIAPYGLEDMDLMARLVAPFTSSAHILGTDELGRDILTRLLYSLRLSFVLAVCGTLIGAILGTALGFLAARFGGVVDDLVNVGVDFTASLPFIILALTILAFLGTDVKVIIVIMAFYGSGPIRQALAQPCPLGIHRRLRRRSRRPGIADTPHSSQAYPA